MTRQIFDAESAPPLLLLVHVNIFCLHCKLVFVLYKGFGANQCLFYINILISKRCFSKYLRNLRLTLACGRLLLMIFRPKLAH